MRVPGFEPGAKPWQGFVLPATPHPLANNIVWNKIFYGSYKRFDLLESVEN